MRSMVVYFLWSDGDEGIVALIWAAAATYFFIKMVWRRVMLRLLWTA